MRRFPTGVSDSSVRSGRQRKAPKPEVSNCVPSVMEETLLAQDPECHANQSTVFGASRASGNWGPPLRTRSTTSLILTDLRIGVRAALVDTILLGLSIQTPYPDGFCASFQVPGKVVPRWPSIYGSMAGNLEKCRHKGGHRRQSRNSSSRAKCLDQVVSLNRGIRNNCAARLAEAGCV
jgi:hypothetical protein